MMIMGLIIIRICSAFKPNHMSNAFSMHVINVSIVSIVDIDIKVNVMLFYMIHRERVDLSCFLNCRVCIVIRVRLSRCV